MKKMCFATAAFTLGSLVLTAGTARAQATAIPTPFHAGQWGIEAFADLVGNGGVTRFFTPRSALVFDVAADHNSTTADDASSNLRHTSASVFDVSLGLRHHTMVAPKIASTYAFGVNGGTNQQRAEYAGAFGNVSSYRADYLGAWAEFGGQYMIADHFAVGFAYRLTGRHLSNIAGTQRGFEFATGFRPIRATLYF